MSKEVASRIAGTVARRAGTCQATRDMTVALPLNEWQSMGVKTLGDGALPKSDIQAGLVSGSTRHFLVYPNYDALLGYNCAHAYALSVALLADRLVSPPSTPRTRSSAARPAGSKQIRSAKSRRR
jgi:membrane-bound lytic murein transglycosylase B